MLNHINPLCMNTDCCFVVGREGGSLFLFLIDTHIISLEYKYMQIDRQGD